MKTIKNTEDMKVPREIEFEGRLDNAPSSHNRLSSEEHQECFNMINNLVKLDISSFTSIGIIQDIEINFISKFEYNKQVNWHFHQWSKTSFLSDNFLSLLQELDEDFYLISKEKMGYISLYEIRNKNNAIEI